MAGRRRRKKRAGRVVLTWVLFILVILAGCVLAVRITGSVALITDRSMEPSLAKGDSVLISSLGYLVRSPARGDIIQFRTQESDGSLIRRIVGMPGETVQIRDGKVYVNGAPLDESSYAEGSIGYSGAASVPVTLQEEEYFVMADSRTNNFDSRDTTIGNIRREDITGRAWLRIGPSERVGLVK